MYSSTLRTALLLTLLDSVGSHDSSQGKMVAIASAYLKQVKDAIAEAYNKHASSRMIVYCRDLCPSLIKEVLGPQSPPSSCSHQTTNQSCTTDKLSQGLILVAGKAASAAQALLATLGSNPCILSFCIVPSDVVYAVYNHPVASAAESAGLDCEYAKDSKTVLGHAAVYRQHTVIMSSVYARTLNGL